MHLRAYGLLMSLSVVITANPLPALPKAFQLKRIPTWSPVANSVGRDRGRPFMHMTWMVIDMARRQEDFGILQESERQRFKGDTVGQGSRSLI